MKLTKQDYLTILKYYNIKVETNTKLAVIKETAERILSEKLCTCIKKLQDPKNIDESRSIAICRKSVLNNKGIKANNFTCKKKARFLGKKGEKNLLKKFQVFTKRQKIIV